MVWTVAVSAVLAATTWAAMGFDFTSQSTQNVPAIAPDPRVRWQPYPVAGYVLASRDTAIVLPPGSVLIVPFAVPDSMAQPENS
jgi:hypothetical protein